MNYRERLLDYKKAYVDNIVLCTIVKAIWNPRVSRRKEILMGSLNEELVEDPH